MTFKKDKDEDQSNISEAVAEAVERLLGGHQSSKVKELLEAAEEATMRAETPGEMQRINRMVRSKIRSLGNIAWLKENKS